MPASRQQIFRGRRLLVLLSLVLVAGFFATAVSSYGVSRQAVREAIISAELPLTSSTIYSEIQRDLIRPILISSTMAHDTFVRDWLLGGEGNTDAIARYLAEVKSRYAAVSSFLVSERSGRYYHGDGVLKEVSPDSPRDAWYYWVRDLREPYEINVDVDLANHDALTIFINYRILDYAGNFLGATGVGLTVDAVRALITDYQARFGRTIYFVDRNGQVVLQGGRLEIESRDLRQSVGIGQQLDAILAAKQGSFSYQSNGRTLLLNVNYLPELGWYLFVEKDEDEALSGIRRTLYENLVICLVITVAVVGLTSTVLGRYQKRIETLASFDKLTGLMNRQALDVLLANALPEIRRRGEPAALLLADLDLFKRVNDRFGHQTGDAVLQGVARSIATRLRESDLAVRWGGEEFLLLLKNCPAGEAGEIAQTLCDAVAAERFPTAQGETAVTLSIGIAMLSADASFDQAVTAADAALYRAKAAGRNRVELAQPPVPSETV